MGISMYNNSSLSVYIKIKQFMVKETTTNLMIWFIIYQFEIVCLWNCLPSTWLHDFYAGELHRLQSSPFDAEINVLNAFQNVMTKKHFYTYSKIGWYTWMISGLDFLVHELESFLAFHWMNPIFTLHTNRRDKIKWFQLWSV